MSLNLKPSDLRYHYREKATHPDDVKLHGDPDMSVFDRNEVYEVIYLIEKVAQQLDFNDKASCHRVEDIIQILPFRTLTQKYAFEWINQHW
ncbi:hypothetical protein [Celerinatantimonas sp. YJH-8]|uniref:hypothetical protein n=1 Tax=Celerinatantimonas sp. YJH-8 TaxID=3228714 RepID=UPI0038C120E2